MLNNLTNFFNLIRGRQMKTTPEPKYGNRVKDITKKFDEQKVKYVQQVKK